MMYVDFNVGEKEYKLRLSTRAIIALEKQLGCNPVAIFGDGDKIPTITTMVQILHAAMQQYNHGVTLNDAYEVYDRWLEDGHSMMDFLPIIVELYKVSGLIKGEQTEKN